MSSRRISELTDSDGDCDNLPVPASESTQRASRPSKHASGSTQQLAMSKKYNRPVRVVEMFSGSGNLSRALRRQGIDAREFDLALDVNHDMSSRDNAQAITRQLIADGVEYVAIAAPCNTHSRANFPAMRIGCLS
jgi:hypothetical protein